MAAVADGSRAPSRAPGRRPARPLGSLTRGTTHPNRLRRADRWIAHALGPVLRRAADPLVVDLGYGASPVTTVELAHRLRAVRPDVEVVGVEIDPARVTAAQPWTGPGLSFVHGGFELPLGGRRPILVRAFNVLRQYDEREVRDAWGLLLARLAPDGWLVEGTCDEPGRRATWVALAAAAVTAAPDRAASPGTAAGPVPRSLTLAAHLASLERPGVLAERLPKALIHRNVPGEGVHAFLAAFDRAWELASPLGVYGARQRWRAAVERLRAAGWPVLDGPARWRLGEVTVAWDCLAPAP